MIFNKNFEDVTYNDIQEMVDAQYPENVILDYKREFNNNKDIAKVVSAFANTYGGFIIAGVEEEEGTNKPKLIRGLDETEKELESRLVNITVDSLTPYVPCQVKFLYNRDKSKKVMVIKIPESDLSPHGVEHNTRWYIRVNDRKDPIEGADLERLDWLRNKREKYVLFRDGIIKTLSKNTIFETLKNEANEYFVECLVGPQYPRTHRLETNRIFDFVNQNVAKFNSLHSTAFNIRDAYHINDGLCVLNKLNESFSYYFEFNRYGYCLVRLYIRAKGSDQIRYVSMNNICLNLIHGHMLGAALLKATDFTGSAIVRTSICNIKNTEIADELEGYGRFKVHVMSYKCHVDPLVPFQGLCNFAEFHDYLPIHAGDVLSNTLYLFGVKDDVKMCSTKLIESKIASIAGYPKSNKKNPSILQAAVL